MGSEIFSILDEVAMSAKEREDVQKKLQNWLVEEGYTVKLEDTPQTYFVIVSQHPVGVPVVVAQELRSKDCIQVTGRLTINEADMQRLRELPEKERIDFFWDLRFSLITNQVQFMFEPAGAEFPDKITVMSRIWYDGLTKDRFMASVQRIVDGTLLTVFKFRQKFGAPAPKKEQFYVR